MVMVSPRALLWLPMAWNMACSLIRAQTASPGFLIRLPALEDQCQATLNYLQLPEWSWLAYISVPLSVLPSFLTTSLPLSPRVILFFQQILVRLPPWNLPFLSHLLISVLFMFLPSLFTCHSPMLYSGLLWESGIYIPSLWHSVKHRALKQ